ncbi:DoxX family protein [Mucilaginibacter segetis]|uniref:DoxX family protein n=1 Tax=Mucilaginibacter segetis TaxID=2793071 RepID=A0A934PVL1_9SPHI|nr:DoxX family protein [Mucilaginibacter segetis]MBK0379901.1 DoxX family protein [Mucilaginibacter segetis]
MRPKRVKIIYWVLTALFVIAMLMDGAAGIAKEKTGREVMQHLGYPVHLMVITGAAKISGALAIIQNQFKTIKRGPLPDLLLTLLEHLHPEALLAMIWACYCRR